MPREAVSTGAVRRRNISSISAGSSGLRLSIRGLPIESPIARADVRVREVFVEVPATNALIPGQRVWGHTTPRVAVVSR